MNGFLRPLDLDRGGFPPRPGRTTLHPADSPSTARFYDAMLRGKDNYAPDRALVREVAALAPGMPQLFRDNRAFVAQAMRRMANQGITQFLDLGCGLPTAENTHQMAQRRNRLARVVYVDRDPTALVHGRALLAENARTAVVDADIRSSCAVFGADETESLIDPSRPVGVLLTAVLHHIDDEDDPYRVVRSYMEHLPSGSMLAVSHFHAPEPGEPLADEARAVQRLLVTELGSGWFRSRTAIAAFFDGLVLDEQGLRPPSRWIATPARVPRHSYTPSLLLCGVARKP